MDVYQRFRYNAIRQLKLRSEGGKGEVLIINHKVEGEYDPATGTVVGAEDIHYTTSGLKVNFKRYHINGTLVLENDVQFYISPLQADGSDLPEPTITDTVSFLGKDYTIVGVQPWEHVGLCCGYKVHARLV